MERRQKMFSRLFKRLKLYYPRLVFSRLKNILWAAVNGMTMHFLIQFPIRRRKNFLKKPHEPLLFIGGENDHIFPPNLTRKIANKYKDANSKVDLKIFKGKSHFICGEEGWEKVADYILEWYEK